MTSLPWAALHDMTQFHWVRQSYGPYDQFDYFSVIVIFILSAFWWRRIIGLLKLPNGKDWLRGKLSLVLMEGTMLSKYLIQFSVDGWRCVPSLFLTWDQTMEAAMNTMSTSFKRSCAHSATLSAPNLAAVHRCPHTSAGTSWTLTGKSGSFPCGVTAPFSWVLVHTGLACALQESVSPVLCKFWWLCGRVNGQFLQEGLWNTRSAAPRARSHVAGHWQPVTPQETLKHSKASLVQFLWGLQVHTSFVWAIWASPVGKGFDFRYNFAPPIIFLGFLLFPWTWGIFFFMGYNILL